MKYLSWLLWAAVFFTLFAFALNNLEAVRVNLFFGTHWQAPLVLVLLAVLGAGVCLGIAVMLPLWLHAKRSPAPQTAIPVSPEPSDSTLPHGI